MSITCSLLPIEDVSRLPPKSVSMVDEPIETLEGDETMALGVEGDLGLGEVHAEEDGLLEASP
jgi:hypothetical protein